jgi:hypothetical protein
MDAFADDLREELDRLLGTQQLELESVLAAADAEVRARRQALAIDAIVRFHADEIDPFLGDADHQAALHVRSDVLPEWERRAPTEGQRKALERAGITLSKLPASFTMADASRLLARMAARRSRGLCSLAQAKRIATGTGIDTRALTFDRAKELCTILRHGSWRPSALRGTPEWRRAHPGEASFDEVVAPDQAAVATPTRTFTDHEALP